MSFDLDNRLDQTSHLAGRHGTVQIRIADDARYFWCLLIPEQNGVSELHELAAADQHHLMELAIQLGCWLKDQTGADKVNTAAIGNIVAQLHLHVVCRTRNDAVWPAPIWGNGDPIPLDETTLNDRVAMIERFLRDTPLP